MYFWKQINKSADGTITNKSAIIYSFSATVPLRLKSAKETGFKDFSEISRYGQKKFEIEPVAENTITVIIIGFESGITIRKNIPPSLQPSIRAASS